MRNKLEPINKILERQGKKITVADLKEVRSGEDISSLKVQECLPLIRAKSSIRPSKRGDTLIQKSAGNFFQIKYVFLKIKIT